MPSPPGNRVVEFCRGTPAPTVVRARLHADDPKNLVEIERVYGPVAPTAAMAKRFADTPEDETLLVALAKDGSVLGTAWPVYRDTVSLELGVPDMSEAEAAGLLRSSRCEADLRALRDRGVRPLVAEGHAPGGGCAHCAAGATSDVSGPMLLVVAVVLVMLRLRSASR